MSLEPFSYPNEPVYFVFEATAYCPACDHPNGVELKVCTGTIGAWAEYKDGERKVLIYFGDFDEHWLSPSQVFTTRAEAEASLKTQSGQLQREEVRNG